MIDKTTIDTAAQRVAEALKSKESGTYTEGVQDAILIFQAYMYGRLRVDPKISLDHSWKKILEGVCHG